MAGVGHRAGRLSRTVCAASVPAPSSSLRHRSSRGEPTPASNASRHAPGSLRSASLSGLRPGLSSRSPSRVLTPAASATARGGAGSRSSEAAVTGRLAVGVVEWARAAAATSGRRSAERFRGTAPTRLGSIETSGRLRVTASSLKALSCVPSNSTRSRARSGRTGVRPRQQGVPQVQAHSASRRSCSLPACQGEDQPQRLHPPAGVSATAPRAGRAGAVLPCSYGSGRRPPAHGVFAPFSSGR